MGMNTHTEDGILVLADISGFTAFVTATEIEHGPPMVAELLGEVMARLSPPLEIQEVEGDAVFALGADRSLHSPTRLLDVLEDAVAAFRTRQRELAADESCACRACRSVGSLDLKIIAHHGKFLRQMVGSRSQAAGVNVVLAHRLLKNGLEGKPAYILLDRSCAALGRCRSGGGRAASPHRALRALRRGTLLREGSRRGRGACRGARGRVGDGVRASPTRTAAASAEACCRRDPRRSRPSHPTPRAPARA